MERFVKIILAWQQIFLKKLFVVEKFEKYISLEKSLDSFIQIVFSSHIYMDFFKG